MLLLRFTLLYSEDILGHIFSFLDVLSLTRARLVCRTWQSPADNSTEWNHHCEVLWSNKQNHPHQLWVKLPIEPASPKDLVRLQMEFLLLQQMKLAGDSFDPYLRDIAVTLGVLRMNSRQRAAAPVSHVIRGRQIQLENKLRECMDEKGSDDISAQVSANIATKVTVDDDLLKEFKDEGTLLTWRESYIASIVDSTRTCINYEVCKLSFYILSIKAFKALLMQELRLFGDWLALLYQMEDATVVRYVSGGHRIISNISFYEAPGLVTLNASTMTIFDHKHVFFRDPVDWSWRSSSEYGFMYTVERSIDLESRNGTRQTLPDGQPKRMFYLDTPLKDYPVYGLYNPS